MGSAGQHAGQRAAHRAGQDVGFRAAQWVYRKVPRLLRLALLFDATALTIAITIGNAVFIAAQSVVFAADVAANVWLWRKRRREESAVAQPTRRPVRRPRGRRST